LGKNEGRRKVGIVQLNEAGDTQRKQSGWSRCNSFKKLDIERKASDAKKSSFAKIRGAIAYLSVGRIPKESHVIQIDGMTPTVDNIRNGNYLLSRTPTLVTRGKPSGETKQLIEFILSAEGQKIVQRMGYLPAGD
jgi:ABC-type phosphate transport system substrate-binding protein